MRATKAMRRRRTKWVLRWQAQHRDRYNRYMRRYMKDYKARKREAAGAPKQTTPA